MAGHTLARPQRLVLLSLAERVEVIGQTQRRVVLQLTERDRKVLHVQVQIKLGRLTAIVCLDLLVDAELAGKRNRLNEVTVRLPKRLCHNCQQKAPAGGAALTRERARLANNHNPLRVVGVGGARAEGCRF